jgi:hypothetical protein
VGRDQVLEWDEPSLWGSFGLKQRFHRRNLSFAQRGQYSVGVDRCESGSASQGVRVRECESGSASQGVRVWCLVVGFVSSSGVDQVQAVGSPR